MICSGLIHKTYSDLSKSNREMRDGNSAITSFYIIAERDSVYLIAERASLPPVRTFPVRKILRSRGLPYSREGGPHRRVFVVFVCEQGASLPPARTFSVRKNSAITRFYLIAERVGRIAECLWFLYVSCV